MPTYEYKCDACNHTFEVFHSIKDEPVKSCETCGGEVRRLISSAGIIFKGSGFYVNDYKSNKSSGKSEPASPAPACSGCAAGGSCPSSGD